MSVPGADVAGRVWRVVRTTPFPRPTTRGWTVVSVGIGLVGAGLVATTSIAVTAGLLLLVVFLLGIVVALIGAAPIRARRLGGRTIVQTGEAFRATIEVTGRTSGPAVSSRLLVRERFDEHFAAMTDPVALVEVGPGRPPGRLEVEAIAVRRGRPVIGPTTVRVEDPFGLLRIDRTVAPAEQIVIVPRTTPLAAIDTGVLAGAVSAEEGRTGQGGSADDSELRVYRPGDPMRRVHWGQSARRGELHVRQTTQAQPPEATVLLDVRRESYQGLGRETLAELSDLGGDAAFEHAVVVAASVARVLAARTSRVALVTDRPAASRTTSATGPARTPGRTSDQDRTPPPAPVAGELADVLVGLADVRVRSDARPVAEVLPDVRGRDAHGMTAVVTGRSTAEQAAELVARMPGATRGLFVAIVPPDATTRGILDRAGWRILVMPAPGVVGTASTGATR
ncbi:DUF58 domain-containing protein [Curtobacterium sp. RRHDQ10]|uniref:DUF58 domain-containing protein n=1 Tax=Curtobacterium phyllosphaerae TaxID=3413379 RepID=UPI003BF3A875